MRTRSPSAPKWLRNIRDSKQHNSSVCWAMINDNASEALKRLASLNSKKNIHKLVEFNVLSFVFFQESNTFQAYKGQYLRFTLEDDQAVQIKQGPSGWINIYTTTLNESSFSLGKVDGHPSLGYYLL